MPNRLDAILALEPNAQFSVKQRQLIWLSADVVKPNQEDIDKKLLELKVEYDFKLLRSQRDRLLLECDWTQSRDVILPNDAEWVAYREALRDITVTQQPALDENDNLINVTWPTKPE